MIPLKSSLNSLACVAVREGELVLQTDAPLSAKTKGGIAKREEDPMSTGFRITVTKTVSGITITIEPW